MISRFRLMGVSVGVVATVVLVGACGGDDGSTGAAEGEACKGGADCDTDLYCALPSSKATEGKCTKLPSACDASAKCTNACGDALDMECNGSSLCISGFGKITYACDKTMNGSSPEGGPCGGGSDCVSGLLCKVTSGAGVCTAAPAECSGTPDCTGPCGDAITALCGGGAASCSGSGTVTLTCG